MKRFGLHILLFVLFLILPLTTKAQNILFRASVDVETVEEFAVFDFSTIKVYSFVQKKDAVESLELLKNDFYAEVTLSIADVSVDRDGNFEIELPTGGALLVWVPDKTYDSRVLDWNSLSNGMQIRIVPKGGAQQADKKVNVIVQKTENSIDKDDLRKGDGLVVTERRHNRKQKIVYSSDVGGVMVSEAKYEIPFRVRSNMRIAVQPVWFDRVNVADESSDTVFSYGKILYHDLDEYSLTQTRLMDFDLTNDTVYSISTATPRYKKLMQDGAVVSSNITFSPNRDTIYVHIIDTLSGYDPDASHPYPFGVYFAVGDYNTVLYTKQEKDEGERYSPLKFLDFKFKEFMPDKELFKEVLNNVFNDHNGELHLNFEVNSAKIKQNDTLNQNELKRLGNLLQTIEKDKTKRRVLIGVKVYGVASPEGTLRDNEDLARRRAEYAMSRIREYTSRPVEIVDTKVAGWDEVVNLLRADSLYKEADTISSIIATVKGIEAQYYKIKRLPFYESLLKGIYLPKLRTVKYTYQEKILGQPSANILLDNYYNDEVRPTLRHADYWALFNYASDKRELEEMARYALAATRNTTDEDSVYCSGYWPYAACVLSCCYIARDTVDLRLLAPFLNTQQVKNDSTGEMEVQHLQRKSLSRIHRGRLVEYINFPEVAANQLIMVLRSNRKSDLNYVSTLEAIMTGQGLQYDTLAAISKCLRGEYKETAKTSEAEAARIRAIVESSSVTNAVVINLAMDEPDDNDSTYLAIADFKSQSLPDNAVSDYLKCIIQFRKAHYAEADSLLANAFSKNINMMRIANNDKDLVSVDRTRFVVSGALSRWYNIMKEQFAADESNAFYWYNKALEELSKGLYADIEKAKEYMLSCFNADKRYVDILSIVIKRDNNIKEDALLSERLKEIINGYSQQQ
ncbi:MAG: hypothetical protein IKZ37_00140 [Bacteroidaceae bacterium]|nr:hypothetical protein [Bacteroidaceae bacterium]